MSLIWSLESGILSCTSEDEVVFADTEDHWRNAVCRLIELTEEEARRWVEQVARVSQVEFGQQPRSLPLKQAVDAIREGTRLFTGEDEVDETPRSQEVVAGATADVVWASQIPSSPRFAVIGSTEHELGWLVETATHKRPTSPTVNYEEDYFEGGKSRLGYGSYLEQESWRLEKARRYLRYALGVARYSGLTLGSAATLLDVGAGYGYFRRAADEAALSHEGIEISHYANQVSKELFGFSSFEGDIGSFAASESKAFDVITLWDVIEHVEDPEGTLRLLAGMLAEGGLIFLRTPSITATERRVFASRYHSFKPEHLYYFGPNSSTELFERAGFDVVFLTTESHLLSGFLGRRVHRLARLLMGSDLLIAGTKRRTGSAEIASLIER